MVLDLRVLREASPVRLVSPDLLGRSEHWVLAGENPRIIRFPHAAVNDDVVTDFDVLDVFTDGPHNTRRVGATDMEVLFEAPTFLPRLDDVDGDAHRGPHVVVVD